MITRAREGIVAAFQKRAPHYRRKRAVAAIFKEAGYEELAQKLYDCQETEVLACCASCGNRWYVIQRCRQRVCPLCSYNEAKKRSQYLMAMTQHMKHPKMLTLTMPRSQDTPRNQIRFLRQCWNQLRRTALFKKVRGGAYQIELKPKPDGFHIHIHILMDAPYMPYQKVFSEWRRITGIEAPQVDIRAADNDSAKAYVCKYTAKSADYTHDKTDIVRWYEATKGQRLFATFGEWYNATLEELLPEGTEPPCAPPCPKCGAVGQMFYARDGPFIYGKDWTTVAAFYRGQLEAVRDISEIRTALEPPQPNQEPTPCENSDAS